MTRPYFAVLWAVVVASLAFTVSCRPDQPKPQHVRPATLYFSYRDDSDIWTNQTVVVELAANTYKVSSRGLEWYARSERDPFDLLFTLAPDEPIPPNSSKKLTVEGVCAGKEFHSSLGPVYYVWVKDCRIKHP